MTDPWGIDDGYEDELGHWHPTTDATRSALRDAMGPPGEAHAQPTTARPGGAIAGRAELLLEDGTELVVDGALPPDLPFGYHRLVTGDTTRPLIVSPGVCPLPRRGWGWAVQVHTLRTDDSWGIGDLGAVAELGRGTARAHGAALLLLSPLGAAVPEPPREPSPYSPSTRRFRDIAYLAIERVPGWDARDADLSRLGSAARDLDAAWTIDRDAVAAAKLAALHAIASRHPDAVEVARRTASPELVEFATYEAIAEIHGGRWHVWPASLHDPRGPSVADFAREHSARVAFHAWVQALLDEQHIAAADEIALVHDLPVGFDRDGADAWTWQHVLAQGVTVGAPPDEFNTQGQDWELPPFAPARLRAVGYEPFIATLRATLRHARGIRIDHVLGLFRQFWIPAGGSPTDGAYVRYPADELLDIVALEAHRADAFVVGEDLGTVEPGVKHALRARGLLGYELLWFEEDDPARWSPLTLGALTTHDLPTVAGLWSGSDLAEQDALGLEPNRTGTITARTNLARWAHLDENAAIGTVIAGAHRVLARAPSVLLTATLEDAARVANRPNLPGTRTEQRANWVARLPLTVDQLVADPLTATIATTLGGR